MNTPNKIDQGIRTLEDTFYFGDRSSREYFQQHWSGYQESGKIQQSKYKTGAEINPCGRYDTQLKEKAKIVIYAALNTTPTTEAHTTVML